MQTIFYVLGALAALVVVIAVPILTVRALLLMTRLEVTRRDLSELVAEASLSLQHVNRVVARFGESVDRIRHVTDRLERVLTLLQPATVMGQALAGAKRFFGGRARPAEPEDHAE